MSIEKRYETMTHEVTEKVLVEEIMYCNICKKKIEKGSGYWDVTTGHYDWGNDSHESIEHFDICSENCLMIKLTEYSVDSGKDDYNTKYIEVEKDYWQ